MDNNQARTQAKKRWGAKFYIRNSGFMSSPERRLKAQNEFHEARDAIAAIDKEIKERLATLDWYQELIANKRHHRKRSEQAQSDALHHRFSVGKQGAMFTEILGSGDTWEEAFNQADALRG